MKNMNKWILFVVLIVPILGGLLLFKIRGDQAVRTPQMQAVEDFYRVYLNSFATKQVTSQIQLAETFFSKNLMQTWQKNLDVCKQKGGTDICGFGADGDIYLNSQEYDPNLNYENSKFRVFSFKEGFVEANFNVYPSVLKAGKSDPYFDRRIRFYMIQENDHWAVDDMAYVDAAGPVSMREIIKKENGTKE